MSATAKAEAGETAELRPVNVSTPHRYRARKAQSLTADMLTLRVSLAISAALGRAEMSREEIAAKLSDTLNEDVSLNMLNAYASAGRTHHNIPMHRLLGLCRVLEDWDLLQDIAGLEGVTVLQGEHARIAEVGYVQTALDCLRFERSALAGDTAAWIADKAATASQLDELVEIRSDTSRHRYFAWDL